VKWFELYAIWLEMEKLYAIWLEIEKLYAIWLREFKVFLRERSRLIASTFTPLLWLFVIGGGLGAVINNPSENSAIKGDNILGPTSTSGVTYQQFIFPGVISMSVIFSSVFFWFIYNMG
jgi:ABC-2 type transport system permease protein